MFWVYASNAERFEQSFRKIADCVKLAGRQDPQTNIFKLVYNWLHECKQNWLLVLDNLDDARFLVQGAGAKQRMKSMPLRECLPYCKHGSILVTIRNKEAALKLVEQRDIIAVNSMDQVNAVALFGMKLRAQCSSQDGRSDVAELAAVLEYMPLAIVQAAAYISQRSPRYSVARYLSEYRKSERKQTSLLNYDEGHLRRDWEAKNSIIVTWQISFEYIKHTRPSAADLLSLVSFFDRQGIPEALLRRREECNGGRKRQQLGKKEDTESGEESEGSQCSTNEDEVEDDIAAPCNFCFVSVETNGTAFEMHTLVQLAMRTWLKASDEFERWKQQFITNLYAEFPDGRFENWATCQTLFAHAKAAVAHQPEADSPRAEWAGLLYRAAWYAYTKGSISDAETLAVKSMRARKKVLGEEHEETLQIIGMVGLIYNQEGRWGDAEKLGVQVMEARKVKLGADHPDTLASMANLASTYRSQGRWDNAEKLEVQLMETFMTTLGADHPDTLTSIVNLVSTYMSQDRWDDAEELDLQVM